MLVAILSFVLLAEVGEGIPRVVGELIGVADVKCFAMAEVFPQLFFACAKQYGIFPFFHGKKPICERILKLDADRYQKGDLPLTNLLSKYCSYMVTK